MEEKQRGWIVVLERWLTDKKSPDIICKSILEYELPENLNLLMESTSGDEDQLYMNACFQMVNDHLFEKFGDSGFVPQVMLSPPL